MRILSPERHNRAGTATASGFLKVADEIGVVGVIIFITGIGRERNERGSQRGSQTSV